MHRNILRSNFNHSLVFQGHILSAAKRANEKAGKLRRLIPKIGGASSSKKVMQSHALYPYRAQSGRQVLQGIDGKSVTKSATGSCVHIKVLSAAALNGYSIQSP